jgi:vancomycin resistance protein VanW
VKDVGQKILLLIIFLSLAVGGFLGTKLFHESAKISPKNTQIGKSLPQVMQSEKEPDAMYHRYGRPVSGPLIWENDRKFHEVCAKYKTSVRMSAFQTTLPDPLPGEEYNVALAADILAGTVIQPGRIFSANQTIGPYSSKRGFREGPTYLGPQLIKTTGGGVCKIASTLYNVATLANLKIIERRQHGMLVPYVPPGQDATVSEGNKDFKFKNNTADPIIIWADTKENTLYMAIYGGTKPPKVTWYHKILSRQDFKTVYRNNRNLKPGEEKVVLEGAEGMTVKNWLTIEDANGTVTKKDLGVDYYRPMLRIIERGTPN